MKKTILLVHRDRELARAFEAQFRTNYVVVISEPKDARWQARRLKGAAVIVAFYDHNDLMYPLMIRILSWWNKVIVWSGYGLDDFQPKCLAAGAFSCVSKLDGLEEIKVAVEEALRN